MGIDGETDPARYIAARTAALRERLTFVAECAARGPALNAVAVREFRKDNRTEGLLFFQYEEVRTPCRCPCRVIFHHLND